MDVPIAKSGTQHFGNLPEFFVSEREIFTAQKVKNLENSGNAICPGSSDETPPNGKWRSSRKFPKSRSFFSCSKIISKNVRGKICKFACAFFCARNKKIRKFQKWDLPRILGWNTPKWKMHEVPEFSEFLHARNRNFHVRARKISCRFANARTKFFVLVQELFILEKVNRPKKLEPD